MGIVKEEISEAESGEIPPSPHHTADTAYSREEPGQIVEPKPPRPAAKSRHKVKVPPKRQGGGTEENSQGGAERAHQRGGAPAEGREKPTPPGKAQPHNRAYLLGPKISFSIGGSQPRIPGRGGGEGAAAVGVAASGAIPEGGASGSGVPRGEVVPEQGVPGAGTDSLLKGLAEESFRAGGKAGLAAR